MKQNNSNNGSQTKISLLYRGVNARALWQGLVETYINKLQDLASIVAARITLERQPESNPMFRVLAILEVPGPDFHAEARDFTLRAALAKVVSNLRRQMQSRKNRQIARRKNKLRFMLPDRPSPARA
jgi:ribosome-associated translation inhibitor RaiA